MNHIFHGDCLDVLPTLAAESINCVVTSPPYYGLRDYSTAGQLGKESSIHDYVAAMVQVFRAVYNTLKPDGTVWLNLGDSYNGSGGNHKAHHKNDTGFQGRLGESRGGGGVNDPQLKPKNLCGIPWRVALALQDDGWYLRQDIIWSKPNPMPEPVKDRCTKAHEYLFLLTKSPTYFFDHEAIQERATEMVNGSHRMGGQKYGNDDRGESRSKSGKPYKFTGRRNRRSVWEISPAKYSGTHFATFPNALARLCILAGSPPGGVVLDPFFGSGTVGEVAAEEGRDWIGIEINEDYCTIAEARTAQRGLFE